MTAAATTTPPTPPTVAPTTSTARSPLPGAATSRAVIDLGAIAHNGSLLAQAAGVPWMAVVKADAYGHGLGPVALTALSAGASWLGVAQLAEALTLRSLLDEAGVLRPAGEPSGRAPRVLTWLLPVMDPARAAAQDSPLRAALAADLDLSVSSLSQLDALLAAVRAQGIPARLHLKVDTGMSRGGAMEEDLPALAAALKRAVDEGTVDVVGLWSHLSRADEPTSGSTEEHLARYRGAERIVREAGLNPPIHHLAATGGLLWHPGARMDLVRVGIGLYGLSPDPCVATSAELGLRPAMRVESALVQVKRRLLRGHLERTRRPLGRPRPPGLLRRRPARRKLGGARGRGRPEDLHRGPGVHGPGGHRPRPGPGRDRCAPSGACRCWGHRRALGRPWLL